MGRVFLRFSAQFRIPDKAVRWPCGSLNGADWGRSWMVNCVSRWGFDHQVVLNDPPLMARRICALFGALLPFERNKRSINQSIPTRPDPTRLKTIGGSGRVGHVLAVALKMKRVHVLPFCGARVCYPAPC